jgi:hypothetical protein
LRIRDPLRSSGKTKEEEMLPTKQHQAYSDFYDAARYNEILEPKTTLMLHLATAMAVACSP